MFSFRISLAVMLASLAIYANELVNPSLELDEGGNLAGWASYRPENPLKIVHDVVQDGQSAIYGEISQEKPAFGIMQVLTYAQPDNRPVTFGGWSKCEGVNDSRDYCIYLDIFFEDGTNDWAKCSYWPTGTHDWEYTVECYWPPKPIAKIEYYVLLRRTTGKAWFDNFELTREDPGARMRIIEVQSTAPFPVNGVQIHSSFFHAGTTYTARIVDGTGKTLAEKSDKGHIVNWTLNLPEGAAKVVIDGMKEGAAPFRNERVIQNIHPMMKENPVKGAFQVWTADSMTNVSPLTYPPADAKKDVTFELAKAERESGQILVTAGANEINAVNVELPVLKNAAGEALKGELKWERVGYIPRNVPHVLSPESGYDPREFWLPDPLLPPREFMVPANATQGVWLTVYADREAAAGDYSGDVKIVIGTETVVVPIKVTVFDFALPKTFSYPTAFCLMDGHLFRTYGDGDRNETRRKAWDIMLDHRLNPDDISRTTPPRIEDLLYARERGMNRFNILNLVPEPKPDFKGLWVCFSSTKVYTDELFEEFKRRLDPYVAELRKHDLTKYAYAYGFDERGDEYNAIMARVHKFFQDNYPDVAFFTTSMMYKSLKANPERTDCYANDWYCPLTSVYDLELSEKLRAKGHQVWWYTCCGPKHPYANMATTEYPFIEGRLLAWMSYLYKADGFLYWHVNMWQNAKRFDDSICYQPDFGVLQVASMAGDGQFLYPGEKGPLPSIRFANIRDGSEDYDYLTMCGASSRGECGELIKSMTEYTRDPALLREMRRRVAKRIIGK